MKFALAFGVLLAVTPAAWADDTADEAEFRFQRATEFYAKGKYEEALDQFFASNRLVKNRNVMFDIARCYEHLNRFNEAYRYYNDLLSEPLPPADRANVKESLARLRQHVALLHVETDPAGAEVFIDRKDLGSRGPAPKTLALPPGKVTVIVEMSGHHPAKKAVTLAKGGEVTTSLQLPLIYGTLDVDGTSGAAVRLDRADGPVTCTIPCHAQVLPGKHSVFVALTGRSAAQLEVDVPPEGSSHLSAELPVPPAPKGSIVVTSTHTGAVVKVDGREAGFTPTVVETTEGDHEVEVAFEDYEPWTGSVSVKADKQSFVNAVLQLAQPKVVAAAKTAMRVEDAPASVTIITSEELRAFGYMTLAEALAGVRGFYTSYDHVYDYVGVRGFSPPGDYSSRELVMVDGHPIMDWWSGQNYVGYDFNVDLSQVDHIEVVRGPGSALYGTEAFFAVINVVTRGAALGTHAEGLLGAGSESSAWGRAAASYESQSFGVYASGALMGAGGEGLVLYDNGQTPVLNRDGWTAAHADARVRAGPFTLFAQYQSRVKETPAPPPDVGSAITQAGAPTSHDERDFVELRYEQDVTSGVNVVARAYGDVSRYYGVTPNDPPSAFYYLAGGATWWGGEARAILGPVWNTRLTLGAEGQWQQIFERSNQGSDVVQPLDSHVENVYSAYALAEWHPLSGLRFTPGIRADYYGQSFGWTVNPRLGLVLRPYDGGITKVIVGSAFRAPTVYERFFTDETSSQPSQLPGGSGLQPERILTAEIEHTHVVNEAVTVAADAYASQISSLVDLRNVVSTTVACPNQTCIQYQNVPGVVRALGAEVEVRYRPERFILASAAYSFQYVRDVPSFFPLTNPGEQIPNSPEHLAVGKLMVPLVSTALIAGVQVTFASSRLSLGGSQTGQSLGIAATVSGDVTRYHLRYSLSAGNLLDERVFLPGGNEVLRDLIPQPGRFFRAQVGASF